MLMIRIAEDWRGIGVVLYEHVQARDPHTHYVEAFFWARTTGGMDSYRIATHHDQVAGFRANEYLTRAACRWLASAAWAVDLDPAAFVEPGLALKPFHHERARDALLDAGLDAPELLEFVSNRTQVPALREVAGDASDSLRGFAEATLEPRPESGAVRELRPHEPKHLAELKKRLGVS